MPWLLTSVCHPCVRCMSDDHITKTKQDRSIVTMTQYIEVGATDCVAIFRSSHRHPP